MPTPRNRKSEWWQLCAEPGCRRVSFPFLHCADHREGDQPFRYGDPPRRASDDRRRKGKATHDA